MHRTLATSAVLGGLLAFAGCGDGDVGEAGSAPDQAESEAVAAATEDAWQAASRDVTGPGWDWAEETEGQIREVPFPIYPGATLVSYSSELEEGELQGLGLQSGDPPSEVLRFYKENASDMRYMEEYNTHFFWRGPEEFDPLAVDQQVPNIQLSEGISEGGTTITMFFPASSD
jgi:hypothetical protein